MEKCKPSLQQHLKSIEPNALNTTFFSLANKQIIQNAIRHDVWQQTSLRHMIGEQSDTELEIVMRSIYLQYSTNRDDHVRNQVTDLNQRVVEHAVPNIINNIKQHESYKEDLDRGVQVMEHPRNVSSAGSKTLTPHFF